MKVAYFTESIPPKTDGVSHTLSHLASTLEYHRVDFLFFAPFEPGPEISWNHRVRKVSSFPFLLYKEYRVSLPVLDNVTEELDRFGPDIVHTVSPTPMGIFAKNYAARNGLPAVSSYHTHFISYFPYYGFSFLENLGWAYIRWFYNQFLTTYAPSSSTMKELASRGVNGVELWQRGIDIERFSPAHRDPGLRDLIGAGDLPILLFVGRLVKEKDLDDLVAAHDILRDWGHAFKLVLVGDGPMRPELERRLPQAHFTGFLHGKALARWYASSDVFVFPSTTETFGNVIQEAFASGLPAVGVRQGGVADLISPDENGLLAQPNMPEDFARAVARLLVDPQLRVYMGNKARRRAAENSWPEINMRLLNSYERVISRFHCGHA